jgi:hypothetical protein
MKMELSFEDDSTKRVLSKLDFGFFLNQNIETKSYHELNIEEIHTSFQKTKTDILHQSKRNKKQFYYYSEGQVRKMFIGGLLPTLFGLNDMKEMSIMDFEGIGDNWAYFNFWRKQYRKIERRKKTWDYIIKAGALLGIILSIFKVLEIIGHKN